MAKNYIVEIGDENGKSCKFSIKPKGKFDTGEWRTIDKGYITENSGTTVHENSNGTLGCNLRLLGGANTYGIQLNDWTFFIGMTNSQGTGWLSGGWSLGLLKGRISWAVIG